MYFSCNFTLLLRRKEAILTTSMLQCKSSNKFAPKGKYLASNNEVILTHWPLKNIFFTFCKRGSAIFKL